MGGVGVPGGTSSFARDFVVVVVDWIALGFSAEGGTLGPAENCRKNCRRGWGLDW